MGARPLHRSVRSTNYLGPNYLLTQVLMPTGITSRFVPECMSLSRENMKHEQKSVFYGLFYIVGMVLLTGGCFFVH